MKKSFCWALFCLVALGFILPKAVCAAIPESERQALIALYEATNGAFWLKTDHWLEPPGTESSWFGVSTDPQDTTVTGLSLTNNRLVGAIPSDIENLPNLRQLFLSKNRIHGPIPPELGSLKELLSLDLSGNELTGTIPPELGGLTDLVFLRLAENQLSGVLPDELGALANLRQLRLTWNQLVGKVPAEYANLRLAEKSSSTFPGGGLDLCGNSLSADDTKVRNLIQTSHVGGIAGFEACRTDAAMPKPSPEEGIWASCSEDIRILPSEVSNRSLRDGCSKLPDLTSISGSERGGRRGRIRRRV